MHLIHITATYSNAVLTAVLPHISTFAGKLELPVPLPITASQVEKMTQPPYKDWVAPGVFLTNGYVFFYDSRGFVDGFRTPRSYFDIQDLNDGELATYYGVDHMTTNDAIVMARGALKKLGYKPEQTHADQQPIVQGPYDLKRLGGHLPYCRVIWAPPERAVGQEEVRFDINMDRKTLIGMNLGFNRTNHLDTTPLKIDVVPELEADYRKRTGQGRKMFINTNAPPRFPRKPPDTD